MSPRRRAYFLLLLVAAIWGFAPPMIKYSYAYLPPVIFLTYRFLITCIFLLPLQFILEPHTRTSLEALSPKDWMLFILGGLAGSTLQLGLLFWGLNLTTALDSSFISATSPILVALAGHYFLKEHVPDRERRGLAIAFLGTVILIVQPVFDGQHLFSGSFAGNFLTLLGTLIWVVYVILTKRQLRHKISPLLLTTNMFFTGFISMTAVAFFLYRPQNILYLLQHASLGSHLTVLYMAVLAGAFGYWAYQKAQKTIPVSEANIFMYLSPLFTVPLAYLWLHEPLTLPFIISSLIIAAGVSLTYLHR